MRSVTGASALDLATRSIQKTLAEGGIRKSEIAHYLDCGERLAPPPVSEIRAVLVEHLDGLHEFYGREQGVRVARKHIGWYTHALPGGEAFRREMNKIEEADAQVASVSSYFARLADTGERLSYAEPASTATDFREKLAA